MMPTTVAYEYAVIRLVPCVEREEFLNVGVILYSKEARFLDLRIAVDSDRLRSFAPQLDQDEVKAYLSVWEWICEGKEEGGPIAKLDLPGRFRWLTAVRSTVIQSSRIHPGRCTAPANALDEMFEKFVQLPT